MLDRSKAVGLLMGTAAALIGGGWQVATRAATTGGELARIAPEDLVVLRYVIPALVLAPVWWRAGLLAQRVAAARPPAAKGPGVLAAQAGPLGWPGGLPSGRLLLLWLGAGLPFGLVAMAGSQHAPAAHMGVLMAGATPLFATLLAFVVWRERPGRARLLGMVLMTLAVALLGGTSFAAALAGAGGSTWRGDALFLAAAFLWAVYTLAFRGGGLTPWQAAAVINGWSAIVVLAWVAWRGGTGLAQVAALPFAWQVLWQGLLGGVLGLWTFSVAIQRLGAAQAAAFGALAPVVSALGGWLLLGDLLTWVDALAVVAAVAGVALASGALSSVGARRDAAPRSTAPAR